MNKIEAMMRKGVKIANPSGVELGDEVDIDRISAENVVLHTGCKIYGSATYICKGARIGYEAPVTIENCYIGPDVALKGGFFKGATFLKQCTCGSGAHVREGTILEEQSSIAHTVGLKQTILFPYVALGSLINFCDCLMTGGTSRNNHSEVGSSYIHFNYTPSQDKATPSIMGDVPRGVMLDQSPVFLGGQGGLVGPSRLAFGTVTAAGTICRNDQLKENFLIFEGIGQKGGLPYRSGGYRNIKRLLFNNLYYIGNLTALQQWYRYARRLFIGPELPQTLYEGLESTLAAAIRERVVQLEKLRQNMIDNGSGNGLVTHFCQKWEQIKCIIETKMEKNGDLASRDSFLHCLEQTIQRHGKHYLDVIHGLDVQARGLGTKWLNSLVEGMLENAAAHLPGFA